MSETTSSVETGLTTVSRVYCGLNCPDGSHVSDSDLDNFVTTVLSREFPDGFSVMKAEGGWRDLVTDRTIREPSAIFEVAHGPQDQERIRKLARAFKSQFRQQAVMIASVPVRTEFV